MRSWMFLLLLCLLAISTAVVPKQKQKFDIVSYQAPTGWKEEKGSAYVGYTKVEGQGFGQIALYRQSKSKGDIQSDFDAQWNELVAKGKTISEPEKTKPEIIKGWTMIGGSGTWKLNGSGVATILTVFSNQQVCISVLFNFNAESFAKEYVAFVDSLAFDTSKPENAVDSKQVSLVGLWADYVNENRGYQNGFPILTSGYFRREYLLNADGTYIYRRKDWSIFAKDILFVYEAGTWKASGNKITFSPSRGSGGWWAKAASSRTTEWGKFKKASTHKLEPVTYTFRMLYSDVMKESSLILENSKGTERDRGTNGKNLMNQWNYSPREKSKSLIDSPPGWTPPKSRS